MPTRMGIVLVLSPTPEMINAGIRGTLPAIGTLERRRRTDNRPQNTLRSPTPSNQLFLSAPRDKTFREANMKDNGRYHVSVDPNTGITYRIELPKTLIGPDGKELTVADAKNTGLSSVVDGRTIVKMDFDPKIGEKGEYFCALNDPSAWFGIDVPRKFGTGGMPINAAWLRMVLDANEVLRGISQKAQKESGICFICFITSEDANTFGFLSSHEGYYFFDYHLQPPRYVITAHEHPYGGL